MHMCNAIPDYSYNAGYITAYRSLLLQVFSTSIPSHSQEPEILMDKTH